MSLFRSVSGGPHLQEVPRDAYVANLVDLIHKKCKDDRNQILPPLVLHAKGAELNSFALLSTIFDFNSSDPKEVTVVIGACRSPPCPLR